MEHDTFWVVRQTALDKAKHARTQLRHRGRGGLDITKGENKSSTEPMRVRQRYYQFVRH